MHERIGEALDHGLVHLGRFAVGRKFDQLAGITLQVMHKAAEAIEEGGDRHHAKHHHGDAQLAAQTIHFFADRAQLGVHAGAGDLRQTRLGDHEFTDTVHQLVETLGRDAHAFGGPTGAVIACRRGFCRPACDRPCRHRRWFDDDRRCDGRCGRRDSGIGSRYTLHRFFDFERHLVHDEDEDVFDIGACPLGRQFNRPCDIEVGRNEIGERRNAASVGDDLAVAHLAQLIEKRERIGAVDHRVGRQRKADAPGLGAGCRRSGDRRGCIRLRRGSAGTLANSGS